MPTLSLSFATRVVASAAMLLIGLASVPDTVLSPTPGEYRAQHITEGAYLYRVTMLRAAPGEFNSLVEALEESFALHTDAGDRAPFWMRHAQGDQWDFMLIHPMESFASHYAPEAVARRESVWASERGMALHERIESLSAYHEDWFARSVPVEEMARRFTGMSFYHVEMFAGLPGARAELLEQRRMENRYYAHLGRQLNVLFTRAGGSNWDAMTIGFYENLQEFAAAGAEHSSEQQEEAARAAGFDGAGAIGPYLRTLLSYHHDTLAVPVG